MSWLYFVLLNHGYQWGKGSAKMRDAKVSGFTFSAIF
jgi:hypothetical protein